MRRRKEHAKRESSQSMNRNTGNRMASWIVGTVVAAACLAVGIPSVAQAQVPGPNGLIAFSSTRDGNSQIYSTTRTGLTVTRLTSNAASDTDPAFSPDGTRIAFVSDRDGGDREIYVMDADGSNQTRITSNTGDDMDPAWSPDGTRLAIRRDIGSNNEIFLIDSDDGGNPVNLSGNAASDFNPEFSPDGTSIAFQRYTSGAGVGFGNEVFLMDADGQNQTNLTNNVNTINDGRPSFSPDGSLIAFDSNENDGRFEIYTMATDGSTVTRLTNSTGDKQRAAYAPEGNQIAFEGGGIGLVAASGGATTPVTGNSDFYPNWQADHTAPGTTITGGPAEGSTVASQDPSFDFTANEPEASFDCRLDSNQEADWAACTSPQAYTGLADGSHKFEVRASDLGGTTDPTPATRNWTVDSTAPSINITQAPPAVTASAEAGFEFIVNDPGATIECRLDSVNVNDWATCSSPHNLAGLTEGSHHLDIRATDQVGNAGTVSHAWTVDQTAPVTTIDVAPPLNNNSVRASFEFSANEAGVTFDCRLDAINGGPWEACASPVAYTGLEDGEHSFEVRATDPAGNTGNTDSHTWHIATTKPNASINSGPANPTADSSASFQFTSDLVGSTFECRLDSANPGDWAACSSPQSYTGLADGSHTFEVRAVELDQGTGPAVSATWTVDTITPQVQFTGTPAPISGTADPSFSFVADEAGTTAECRLDSTDSNDWAACTSPHQLNSLTEGGHKFEVRVTDAVGHVSNPTAYNWIVETTPPVATITSGPEDPTTFINAAFEFETANPNAFFECRFDGSAWGTCTSGISFDQLADGSHNFEVRAVGHGAGPGPVAAASWTVDTVVPRVSLDSTPDALTNQTGASFGFSVSKPGYHFRCTIDSDPPAACTAPAAYSGLAAGDHTFLVEALDSLDQVVDSASFEWTILAAAPVSTLNGQPPALSGSATAALTFSSDVPTAGFECRIDGGSWGTCHSPAAFTGLGEGSHTAEVRASLPGGPAGSPASATWVVDTIAPDVRLTGGPSGTVNAAAAAFGISNDDLGATTECSVDSGPWQACAGTLNIGGLADGDHEVQIRSIDQAGNTGSDRRQWTVDATGPTSSFTETPAPSTTDRTARFNFTSTDSEATFRCRVDGGDWGSCAPVVTLENFELGSHEFTVQATDQMGNAGPEQVFSWDVVNPPLLGLVPTIKIRKKVKLDRDGVAPLADINCPEGRCLVKAPKRVYVKAGGRRLALGVKVIRTHFSKKTKASLITSPQVRSRIAGAGSARIKLKIKVSSDNGKSRTVSRQVKLTVAG